LLSRLWALAPFAPRKEELTPTNKTNGVRERRGASNQQMKQRKEANERNQFNEIELMNGLAPFALWNELVMAGAQPSPRSNFISKIFNLFHFALLGFT